MFIYLYSYCLVAALGASLTGLLYLRRRVQFLRARLSRAEETVQVLTNERDESRHREGQVDAGVVADSLERLSRDIQELRALVIAQSRSTPEGLNTECEQTSG
jgi:hypothetical protein